MTVSQLKITYAGIVLLDHGEKIERRPEISATGLAQAVDYAGAVKGKTFGRMNERGAMSWTRLKSWVSHEEAQGMALALRKLVPMGKASDLLIEVENGATFTVQDFVMTDLRAETFDFPGFHTREDFTGQGGDLVITSRGSLGGDEMGDVDNTELMGAAGVLFTMGEPRTY